MVVKECNCGMLQALGKAGVLICIAFFSSMVWFSRKLQAVNP